MKHLWLAAALIGVWLLSSCRSGYDHRAEKKIGGIAIRVGLEHSHPWLAEYRKYLEIEDGGSVRRKEMFQDTGGYAWVALINDRGRLEVRDLAGTQLSADADSLPAVREYLGRFDFDSKRTYRFIPASEDAREPRAPW